ncbi:unnamed protein product [Paramecium octaurelia]|uniref:Uncharacterized protein n=1 Tax=Paramecium octaurelia TaxID=43137 RepID=A0A8S1X5L2_PAROT|nr:unnamed protein product [Paramecium octaurelia]
MEDSFCQMLQQQIFTIIRPEIMAMIILHQLDLVWQGINCVLMINKNEVLEQPNYQILRLRIIWINFFKFKFDVSSGVSKQNNPYTQIEIVDLNTQMIKISDQVVMVLIMIRITRINYSMFKPEVKMFKIRGKSFYQRSKNLIATQYHLRQLQDLIQQLGICEEFQKRNYILIITCKIEQEVQLQNEKIKDIFKNQAQSMEKNNFGCFNKSNRRCLKGQKCAQQNRLDLMKFGQSWMLQERNKSARVYCDNIAEIILPMQVKYFISKLKFQRYDQGEWIKESFESKNRKFQNFKKNLRILAKDLQINQKDKIKMKLRPSKIMFLTWIRLRNPQLFQIFSIQEF